MQGILREMLIPNFKAMLRGRNSEPVFTEGKIRNACIEVKTRTIRIRDGIRDGNMLAGQE